MGTGAPKSGGASRDRTDDLLHAMQALSQLSYSPTRGGRTLRIAKVTVNRPPRGELPPLLASSRAFRRAGRADARGTTPSARANRRCEAQRRPQRHLEPAEAVIMLCKYNNLWNIYHMEHELSSRPDQASQIPSAPAGARRSRSHAGRLAPAGLPAAAVRGSHCAAWRTRPPRLSRAGRCARACRRRIRTGAARRPPQSKRPTDAGGCCARSARWSPKIHCDPSPTSPARLSAAHHTRPPPALPYDDADSVRRPTVPIATRAPAARAREGRAQRARTEPAVSLGDWSGATRRTARPSASAARMAADGAADARGRRAPYLARRSLRRNPQLAPEPPVYICAARAGCAPGRVAVRPRAEARFG